MRRKFCLGSLFSLLLCGGLFCFCSDPEDVVGVEFRGLAARSSGQSGHPSRRGSDKSFSCCFNKTAWFAFHRRTRRGRFDSSKFVEAKMRFASWASCWNWKAILESSPEYVTVLALAVRGPIRTECVFCFFRTEKSNSRLGNCFSAPETVACRGKTELA